MICSKCGNELQTYTKEIKDYDGSVIRKENYIQCPYCATHDINAPDIEKEYKYAIYFGIFISFVIIIGTFIPFAKFLNVNYSLFKISAVQGSACVVAALVAVLGLYIKQPLIGAVAFVCSFIFSFIKIGYSAEIKNLFNTIGINPSIDKTIGFYLILCCSLVGIATSIYCQVRKNQMQNM